MSRRWTSLFSVFRKEKLFLFIVFMVVICIISVPFLCFIFPFLALYILAFFILVTGIIFFFEGTFRFQIILRRRSLGAGFANEHLRQCFLNWMMGVLFIGAGLAVIRIASLPFISYLKVILYTTGICINPLIGIATLSYVLLIYNQFIRLPSQKEKIYNDKVT